MFYPVTKAQRSTVALVIKLFWFIWISCQGDKQNLFRTECEYHSFWTQTKTLKPSLTHIALYFSILLCPNTANNITIALNIRISWKCHQFCYFPFRLSPNLHYIPIPSKLVGIVLYSTVFKKEMTCKRAQQNQILRLNDFGPHQRQHCQEFKGQSEISKQKLALRYTDTPFQSSGTFK